MKKKIFAVLLVAVVSVGILMFNLPTKATQPGTDTDPLVTRRYVEDRISQLQAEIELLRGTIANISPNSLPNVSPAQTPPPASQTTPPFSSLPVDEQDELFALVMYYFETVYGERLDAAIRNIPGPAGSLDDFNFEVINPQAGQVITFDGGTEFILRAGRASAVTGAVNGIPNVTSGTDVMNGENIALNNLFIVPVTDGRGINFHTDSWLMVRGGWS